MLMKRVNIVSVLLCVLVSVMACTKAEDAPYDKQLRVVFSPALDNFLADGKTATDSLDKFETIVKIMEGTSISSQTWAAQLVDSPWATIEKGLTFTENFTDIYSGNSYSTDESGIAISMTANEGNSRNAILRITTQDGSVFDFKIRQKGLIPDAVHITNMDEFNAWLKTQSEWSSADETFLDTDIDLDGVKWEPINYPGTFDGQGHCIYNFVQEVNSANFGFFGALTGSLKNVVFGSKDGKTYDGVSKIKFDGAGGVFWVGMISNAQGDITSVKNFVDLEIASTSTANIYAAPFIGAATKAGITIRDCENHGNLTSANADKTAAKEALLGGILSRCNPGPASSLNVIGCKNYGNLITMDPYTTAIGGIVGNCPSGNLVYVENCENFGNVAINSTETPDSYKEGFAGGIVGMLNGNKTPGTVIKGCINHANLTADGKTLGDYGGIAGRIPTGDIIDCTNEGNVIFDGENNGGNALLLGGITGGVYKGGKVSGCVNKGKVASNKNQVTRAGGIIGTINTKDGDGTAENCINEGTVSIARTSTNDNWQAAGGIVGFQEGTNRATVKGCTNKGGISVTLPSTTTHKNKISAGGIIGLCAQNMSTSGNVNEGNVTTAVNGDVANYAGGFVGWFQDGSSDNDSSVATVNGTTAGSLFGSNAATVTNAQAAGSVNGTTVTEANVANTAAGANTGSIDVKLKK